MRTEFKSKRALVRHIRELDNIHQIERLRIIVFKNQDSRVSVCFIVEFKPSEFLTKAGISKTIQDMFEPEWFKGGFSFEFEHFNPQQEQEANAFGH